MNDHKLNEAMARLCGIPVVTWDPRKDAAATNCVHIVNMGAELHLYTLHGLAPNGVDLGGCYVFWNPAKNWQQAMECVIPALRRRNCDIQTLHSENLGDHVEVVQWDPKFEMPDEDLSRRGAPDGTLLTPRLVCKAVLEAYKKLEAADE